MTACVLETRVGSCWTFQTLRRLAVLVPRLDFVRLSIEGWLAVHTLRPLICHHHGWRTIFAIHLSLRYVRIHCTWPAGMCEKWFVTLGARRSGGFGGGVAGWRGSENYASCLTRIYCLAWWTLTTACVSGSGVGSGWTFQALRRLTVLVVRVDRVRLSEERCLAVHTVRSLICHHQS